ncbi:GlcG/HbpS family heme-binding protein [Pandoraea communis]|uniref:Cobalamin adenosyltransferase n=1 Tax=Pandoraea communis TaxID=2508297 RepID=A0A5E4Z063_9BURK|nr:heme-binding protein [Pandoraea communis]MDM8359143.1 heme-binding protein [Pandoraea communis]VVE54611.1 cobalamin adenosyltransferase [Pandoraea communis]
MSNFVERLKLTHAGAQAIVTAAVAHAQTMGQPQCIAVVDDGCRLMAFLRMDGAKVLSEQSAIRKAMTAASNRAPTGNATPGLDIKLALATDGCVTHLLGGLPIVVFGHVIGGIGVGSGTGEQDVEVAKHALKCLDGTPSFE